MGNWQKHNKTSQTRKNRPALSQQVTMSQQWTDKKTWRTLNINKKYYPQNNNHIRTISKSILLEGFNQLTVPALPLVQM